MLFTLPTVACYQGWPRSSAAVNMTSVWKRSISLHNVIINVNETHYLGHQVDKATSTYNEATADQLQRCPTVQGTGDDDDVDGVGY